jgi:hypothetical protein
MLPIKKFALFVCFICAISMPVMAQTVKVKKEDARVKGENVDGFVVDLDGKPEDVNSSLSKFMKSFGKARQNDGTITLTESTINGSGYKNPIYALTKEKGTSAQAWIGVKKSEWPDGTDAVNKDIEKILYDFGVKFYKDKIQLQIDESARAFQAVEKTQQRLTTQGRDLTMKLEDNKREKIQLEKSIENNKLENEMLLKKIEKNKHDQDSMVVVNGQVKKVVEAHKERQKKVN